ncbi:MAG TPA: choline dehydrogenase [Steroidobacteraceae bacterium]|nr:choline dehydrogenase [Steroidobacteraceae bacterium]
MSMRYIIIGAGSAGCVLANRLSADPSSQVLLLEAGGRDINPLLHMPAGLAQLVNNQTINWAYYTEPQHHLNERRLYWPRGRVLGGSSSINAMCYTRGQPQDYDDWAAAGNSGWSYDDVLPYFRRSEHQQHGESEYHGAGGPLDVEDLRYRNPLTEVFVAAGVASGFRHNQDFNGERQEGIGFYQVTQRRGRRCSAAVAYLNPVRSRRNLHVITDALVQRIVVKQHRACAVEYQHNEQQCRVDCDGEVMLCAGAIGSPQLLMLSGIGPAEHLHELSIPVIVDLPGVGGNLHDHLDVCTLYKCKMPVSYDFTALQRAGVALRYLFTRNGPGVSNIAEGGAFICSHYSSGHRPDIQLHFVPAQLDDHGRNRLPGHGFTIHACYLHPRSRGEIRLRANRADVPPLIQPNYLDDGMDMDMLVEGVKISRELASASPFDAYRGAEVFPGTVLRSDVEIAQFIRNKAETIYHPVGTCRMGQDRNAVVDNQLCVAGISGLRVVDASIMPALISGNTNAPTIMIAEKAADLALGRITAGRSAVNMTRSS